MENWGLITGRTSVYLYDPVNSGIAAQKLTTGVQSHEVAHQVCCCPDSFVTRNAKGSILVVWQYCNNGLVNLTASFTFFRVLITETGGITFG